VNHPLPKTRDARAGTVLIVTMWIVLVVAGLTLVFTRSARVEALASANHVAALQASAVADGAVQYLVGVLDGADGSMPEDVLCQAVGVGEGYFWILGPRLEEDDTYTFRLVDEASKMNLNSADVDALLGLPDMTAELAAALKDWRDQDGEVSEGGAESEYYLLLPEPYLCKDDQFETVEEVLLVKDADLDLLYGEDENRNGVLDENENDAGDSEPDDYRDGNLDRGFWEYVTVYSAEPNTSSDGEERVNVNDADSQALSELLRSAVSDDRYYSMMDLVYAGRPFSNVLDFYGSVGLTMEEFGPIADRLTTTDDTELVGLMNIYTVPREVLLCLPGLDESDVDALLAARQSRDTTSGIAWVADVLDPEKAVAIGDYITGRSYQFSADIVSVSGDGRAYKRCRVVLDARESPPKVVYRRDLTHLGWPLDPEILSTLRKGEPLDDTFTTGGGE